MNNDSKPVKIISTKKMLNQCFDKIHAQTQQIQALTKENERLSSENTDLFHNGEQLELQRAELTKERDGLKATLRQIALHPFTGNVQYGQDIRGMAVSKLQSIKPKV